MNTHTEKNHVDSSQEPLIAIPDQPNWHLMLVSGPEAYDQTKQIIFPAELGRSHIDDPYLDAKHAELKIDEGNTPSIEDLRSGNGVWIRLRKQTTLTEGDELIIGSRMYRVCRHA